MGFFTEEQVELLSASTVRAALLVEFAFASETKYLWNGHYRLTSGGHVWEPMRGAATIDGLDAPAGNAADTVTFALPGLPTGETDHILALALEETPEANQRSVRIYLQLFNGYWQPVGSPIGIWWGFLQPPKATRTPASEDIGGVQTVSIEAENAFFNRARPPAGRYTDRDQQKRSPGDKFFQFTSGLSFKTFWYPSY